LRRQFEEVVVLGAARNVVVRGAAGDIIVVGFGFDLSQYGDRHLDRNVNGDVDGDVDLTVERRFDLVRRRVGLDAAQRRPGRDA
jgi:hypothetical protein